MISLLSYRVQFSSVQSFDQLGCFCWLFVFLGGHEGRFSRDSLPGLSAGGFCEQIWYG